MKISALLREKAPSTPALSLDQDLMQRAMLRFPGYDSQQALSLYMADKLNQQQKIDASQNNLINAQRSAIQTLQGELDSNEDEVERIKQLTAKVTAGSVDTREKAKVSGNELEKLQQQLEELKNKPNLDPQQYKEMEAQIMALASNPSAENSDVRKLQNLVNQIDSKATVNYDAVYKQLQATQEELDKKEERFQKSINKNADKFEQNASEFRKYADIVDGYKNKIDKFDTFMNSEKETILNLRGAMQDEIQQVQNDSAELNKLIHAVKTLYKTNISPNEPVSSKQQPEVTSGNQFGDNTEQDTPADLDPAANDGEYPDLENSDDPGTAANDGEYPDIKKKGARWDIRAESIELKEEIALIKKPWSTPKFNIWMQKNIQPLLAMFKAEYQTYLDRIDPTYGDEQIIAAIQEESWFVKKMFDIKQPLTPKVLASYMAMVKDELFSQAPELQQDLELTNESVDMLDRIINLSSIKKG
jgi:hypothetical protein